MYRRTIALALLALSCGASGLAQDPRCTTLCQYRGPQDMTYGSYCSEASARLCADNCTVRIAGVGTVCQSCLLEDASFSARWDGPVSCTNGTCTVSSGGVTCSYPSGDDAQQEACLKKVFPLSPTECTPSFRDVSMCSSVCSAPK